MMGLGLLIALPAMIVVVLAVLAVPLLAAFYVVRWSGALAGRQTAPDISLSAVCSNCHRGVQTDWRSCPYCGQKVA